MRHSMIDKYRLPDESDSSWSLRKEFIERYMGDFPEATLLSLAKVYSEVESGGCSNAAPSAAAKPVVQQQEQQVEKSEVLSSKEAKESSAKEKSRTLVNSQSRPSVKMKQKGSAASKCSSGASSQKRASCEVLRGDSQRQDEVSFDIPRKKSRLSGLKSTSEGPNRYHYVMSKGNGDSTLKGKSFAKIGDAETGTSKTTKGSDIMEKAKLIALQYSLGETVLQINTWPEILKNDFISILQFVKKCFSKGLSTLDILHSMSKRFKLKLQYCTKQLPPVRYHSPPSYTCSLKVDSVLLAKGNGSTFKKARLAAAKELIDKLMRLSREVGNLSSSYFNKSGKSVECEVFGDSEMGDTSMNGETEHVEYRLPPDGSNNTQSDISFSCENDSGQGRSNVQCNEGRQNSRGIMSRVKHPKDLGSDSSCEIDMKPTLHVGSRNHNHAVVENDTAPVRDINTTSLANENILGAQRNFDTEIVSQNVEEAKSCAFKKIIRFSNGLCVVFGFDKDNRLLDISGHDSTISESKVVPNSAEEMSEKLGFKVSDMVHDDHNLLINKSYSSSENIVSELKQNPAETKSLDVGNSHLFRDASNRSVLASNSNKNFVVCDDHNLVINKSDASSENIGREHKKEPIEEKSLNVGDSHPFHDASNPSVLTSNASKNFMVCDDHNLVINKSDSSSASSENIGCEHKQNPTKEKSLDASNSYLLCDASNPSVCTSKTSKNFILQQSSPIVKNLSHRASRRWISRWDSKHRRPRSHDQEAAPKVRPPEIKSNSTCNRDLGVAFDVLNSAVLAQNAFNAFNSGASDSSQRITKELAGNTIALKSPFPENCTSKPIDPRPIEMFNSNNGCQVVGINEPNDILNASASHEYRCGSAELYQTRVLAQSCKIFFEAFHHTEQLIMKLVDPLSILKSVCQTFSASLQFHYTIAPNGYECLLAMDNIPMCKAYGLSETKARFSASKLAIYKFVELAVKAGIINPRRFTYILMWYNAKVDPARRLPIDNLNPYLVADTRVDRFVEVVCPKNFQNPEPSTSCDGPTNQFICGNTSQQTCSKFVAILNYSDIAEAEKSVCVLEVAAELNQVKLRFSCETVASDTGFQGVRATAVCDGNNFSTAMGETKCIAIQAASLMALCALKRTAYIIKMKLEHFDGFIINHDQLFKANRKSSKSSSGNQDSARLEVKKIIEDYKRTNPCSDLLFYAFNSKERSIICKVAKQYNLNSYSISGRCGDPRNIIVTRFFTARDLLKHLTETTDKSCKLKYEVIPPGGQ